MTFTKWIAAAVAVMGGIAATPAVLAAPTQMETAAAIEWKTDFHQAAQEAKASGKPMLLVFTGSDWCGACKRLEREVLQQSEFAEAFGDRFVFVELDFPKRSAQPPGQAEQNKDLQRRFGVQGFPTVVMLDSDQKQVGQSIVGYSGGGVRGYVAQLDSAR